MSVHYKFKSTLNFDTITFDGLHISVADLKKEIVQQKRLGKIIDFDLQITNAQTKEEYKDDGFLIPKNTTLIISRIPITYPVKKGWDPSNENAKINTQVSKPDGLNMDLFKMQGTEEDKIQAMMMQSTADYDPKTYHRIKGQSQIGEVPASYRCNKCKRGGHWIKNCTFASGKEQFEMKRNTGIPRSFRGKPDNTTEQDSIYTLSDKKEQDIPEDLICGICRNIFVDAVMIPCCGSSFCDDCVRTSLLESEESECPDCKEKNCSPGSLIPNRFLRNSVNVFKNETQDKLGTMKFVNKIVPINDKKDEIEPLLNESTKAEDSENTSSTTKESSLSMNVQKTEVSKKDKYDSDYEDNITIKMPQKVIDSSVNIKESNKEKISPSYSQKIVGHNVNPHREPNFDDEPDAEIKQLNSYVRLNSHKPQNDRSLLPTPIGTHHKYHNINMNEQRDKPVNNPDHRLNPYKPRYMPMPRCPSIVNMPAFNNGFNNLVHRQPSFVHYPNQPVSQINTPYMPIESVNVNPLQTFQSASLASIYQGVAAKVGTGLIDDPLEAFNRIMKEKEKQKEDRRRSPGLHRSRSPGRLRHRFKSPVYDTSKEFINRDKRMRSRERKRDYSYERRQGRVIRHSSNGSSSPSDKKRYVHRRSPSPKYGSKTSSKDKNMSKRPVYKTDTVEPPPPGFESLQIDCSTENSNNRVKRPVDSDVFNKSDDQYTSRKRTYSSQSVNVKAFENSSKSLTPPTNSKISKISKGDFNKIPEHSPKTPRRNESNLEENEENQNLHVLNSNNNSNVALFESNMEKENNIEINSSPLKDRKKKKKIKSDRKKSKKDKKDKKDKNKKSHADSIESISVKMADDKVDSNLYPENTESHLDNLKQEIPTYLDLESLKKVESDLMLDDVKVDNLSSNVNDVQISKWELEDSNFTSNLDPSRKISLSKNQDHSEITSDVIRKAENAIFAKAINAIRPVEFKVVIDSKRNSKESAISFKTDYKDRSHSPKSNINKSVKERLGNKIVNEQNYSSSSRSKSSRKEISAKASTDNRHRYSPVSYNIKKEDKPPKCRVTSSERNFEDHRNRKSKEREVSNKVQKEQNYSETNKNTHQSKSKITSSKCENESYESNRSSYKSQNTGELRLNSQIASRPCRPDNPFRKFDENNLSSNKNSKYNNLLKREVAHSFVDEADDKVRKDKKQKKIKTFRKRSSSESVKSEKLKDSKSKRKSKMLKKKKKSRK